MNLGNIEKALVECDEGIKKFQKIDVFYLLNADLFSLKNKNNEKEKKKNLEIAVNTLKNGIKLNPESYKLYIKLSDIFSNWTI